MRPGAYAVLAAAAESMYDQNSLTPTLPAELAASWKILDYITGLDALFGAQAIGLGERVFYGFLAQNVAQPDLYVAVIRGTECAMEWLIDAEAQPMLVAKGGGMTVHAGFWTLYTSLTYGSVAAASGIVKALPQGASVVVVGHSLGAALAIYLMTALAGAGEKAQGMIFASPKPGDAAFANYVDAVVGAERYTVYNYSRDLVPHAPLTLPMFPYRQLNNVSRITPATAQVAVKHDPACCHSALSYAAMLGEPVQSTCILGSPP